MSLSVFLLILFLSHEDSLFEKLGVLSSVKSIALHALLSRIGLCTIILHENFYWFKFFLFINGIIFIVID